MKIIASDYDGTLSFGGIDEAKVKAIEDWRKAGNIFAVISGRIPNALLSLYRDKNFECDYLVADNGAVILTTDGETVFKAECDGALAKPLIKLLFECGADWAFVQSDSDFNVYNDRLSCSEPNDFTLSDMPEVKCFNQINTKFEDFETAAKVTRKIADVFCGKLNPLQNGNCIDIVRSDINKARGVYTLMRLVGAEHSDVITVGDNINDMDMITEFRSYAMANGVESIKKAANYITSGITELIAKEL